MQEKRVKIMRKELKFIFLWLVFFLAFQVFACKSVQKGVKEEPGEETVTMSQTNTMETETGKAAGNATGKTANATGKAKTKAGSTETGKGKAGSNETGKEEGKPETFAGLKEKVITELEKKISPTVRKAILPSVVGLLILASLMSIKKEKNVNKSKKISKNASPQSPVPILTH